MGFRWRWALEQGPGGGKGAEPGQVAAGCDLRSIGMSGRIVWKIDYFGRVHGESGRFGGWEGFEQLEIDGSVSRTPEHLAAERVGDAQVVILRQRRL